ncbi:ATP-binding protein [Candidatus Parcubacteria bacterium]|nr:ATP-binding protein [Patescibacteria group bacterium]MCG2689038.1 ATP-binding protein [Candidatus Parcubacteria bacterium]
MNLLTRQIDSQIKSHFKNRRQILLLLGARQVGKTTLLKRLFPEAQYFLLDNDPARKNFETYDIHSYRQFIGSQSSKTVIIDEIQLLPDPGRAAKIIYDQMPNVQLIITGSSALNIKNTASESLAGRKIDYQLFPLTFSEYLYQTRTEEELHDNFLERLVSGKLSPSIHQFDLSATVGRILTYGLNPYLVQNPSDSLYLSELASSSIYKDIFELNLIENRAVASNLLKLLAYQIGNLINYSELAAKLGVDARTVQRYISIFEQSFILFRLYPFTSKRRDEIGKAPKIYFYDLGLRNAVIEDFSNPFLRRDFGAMFENFVIGEILKHNVYSNAGYKLAFWRTVQGAEVDLVLHQGEEVIACEIKTAKGRACSAFNNRYPNAKVKLITIDNFY